MYVFMDFVVNKILKIAVSSTGFSVYFLYTGML